MDRKMTAMLQIKEIMDDEADKDHSENSENSEFEQQQEANSSKDKDAADEDGAGGRDRMGRGGSVTVNDDTIFGEPVIGRKRSNSIETNRPRARQEHTNVFGSILENIHENINFEGDEEDDAHPEEETGESAPS